MNGVGGPCEAGRQNTARMQRIEHHPHPLPPLLITIPRLLSLSQSECVWPIHVSFSSSSSVLWDCALSPFSPFLPWPLPFASCHFGSAATSSGLVREWRRDATRRHSSRCRNGLGHASRGGAVGLRTIHSSAPPRAHQPPPSLTYCLHTPPPMSGLGNWL